MPVDSPTLSSLIDELQAMPVHVSRTLGRSRKKPLLVLLLASKIAHGHQSRRFVLSDVADELSALILEFGERQESGNPHPEQPFYHLGTSSFWTCVTKTPLTGRRRTPNPSQIQHGELVPSAYKALADLAGREQIVAALLNQWTEPQTQRALRLTLRL